MVVGFDVGGAGAAAADDAAVGGFFGRARASTRALAESTGTSVLGADGSLGFAAEALAIWAAVSVAADVGSLVGAALAGTGAGAATSTLEAA